MTLAFYSLKACCSEGVSDFFIFLFFFKIAIAKVVIDRIQASDIQGYRFSSRSVLQLLTVQRGDNFVST